MDIPQEGTVAKVSTSIFRFRVLVALACLAGLGAPREAQAIPAFARRYETSCQTCHLAYPKLTPFGEAFRRNAYRFPGGGDAVSEKEEPIPLGNEAQAERWPDVVYPGQLPGSLPLSVLLSGKVQYGSAFETMAAHGETDAHADEGTDAHAEGEDAHADAATAELDASAIFEMAGLRAGGTFGDHVAFLMAINVGGHSPIETERANVVFTPLAEPTALLVKVGRFEPEQHGVSLHRNLAGHLLRLTTHGVTGSGFTVEPYKNGVQLSGVAAKRVGWAVGAVENTTPAAFVAKDAYGRAEVKLGGMPLDGSGNFAGTAAWRERSVLVGASAWSGREVLAAGDDQVLRLGGDVHVVFGDLMLDAVVVRETHTLALDGGPVAGDQLYGELTWVVLPVVFPSVRFEAAREDAGDPDWLALGVVNALVRPNVFLRAEVGVGAEPGEEAGFRFTALEWGAAF